MSRERLRIWRTFSLIFGDFVLTGFTVAAGVFPNVTVAVGKAHAGGVYMARDVTTSLAMTDDATNHIFVTIDENNSAGAITFTVNTTGAAPATPYVKLATVVAAAGAFGTITDVRTLTWFSNDPIIGAKYFELYEISAPASPAADRLRFYAKDDGGKTKPAYKRSDGTEVVVGGGILPSTEVNGVTQAMAVDNVYIANNASTVELTLPTTAPIGSINRVIGKGAGGWRIKQNANQKMHHGATTTTTGVDGALDSTHFRDVVDLVCVVADTEFTVISHEGTFAFDVNAYSDYISFDAIMEPKSQTNWSSIGGASMLFAGHRNNNATQNAELTYDVVLRSGTWDIEVVADTGNDNGIIHVKLDDVEVGTLDSYAGSGANSQRIAATGIVVSTSGHKVLKLKVETKNASSSGYEAAVSNISLRRTGN